MNREAEDLRETLLNAIFEDGCEVVDLRNGETSVHRTVTGNEDSMIHAADVHFVAIA